MTNKLLFAGRASVGKTTIKKVVFENERPEKLMLHSLEPTRGIKTNVYSWLDLEIGIFDTSGQELLHFLEEEETKEKMFRDTSILVYVIGYPKWMKNKLEIVDEINKIKNLLSKYSENAKMVLFFHKADLIKIRIKNPVKKLRAQLNNINQNMSKIPIYLTSIEPDMNYALYHAVFDVLSELSEKCGDIEGKVKKVMEQFEGSVCILRNQKNQVIKVIPSSNYDLSGVIPTMKALYNIEKGEGISILPYEEIFTLDIGKKLISGISFPIETDISEFKDIIILTDHTKKGNLAILIDKNIISQIQEEKKEGS